MRAAILRSAGSAPELGTFDDPTPSDGQLVVNVTAAGLNPVDLYLASGQLGDPKVPRVVGQEGVGTLDTGRRVYFNPSVPPFGSWAERTLVDPEKAFQVPDGLDDALAVAMGIPALAAWLPLEHHARLRAGESVLVLGATGVVGRVAVQAAKILGAGRVVAAARNEAALGELKDLGADDVVVLGGDDNGEALRAAAQDGFDVVIDPVYGAPFEAALSASAIGARLVTIGESAGQSAEVPFRALQGRAHIGHGNNVLPTEVVRDAYEKLTEHAAAGRIRVDVESYSLERAVDAWHAQAEGPHRKLVVVPNCTEHAEGRPSTPR
jgi:NADPH:quinone reductase-like Zn-dependent oxidoreductase